MKNKKVVIIGSGPAGLTAGFELLKKNDCEVTILERDSQIGGLAKTIDFNGYRFDIGPHHYITDSPRVEKWWKDLMEDDFIPLNRFTRIYYKNRFFNYPLEAFNVLKNLSIFECFHCVFSYLWIRILPKKEVKSFQDWVTNRFGSRLFQIFFKTYTEKVWGIKCTELSADWAAERIKGFSMSKAIFYAFFGKFLKKNVPRTLSTKFYYPSKGSGTLWQKVANNILQNSDGKILCNQDVVIIEHENNFIKKIGTSFEGKLNFHEGDFFLSSMPLQELILAFRPYAPQEIIKAANFLKYRALVTVNLVIDKKNIFPDHWMYIHDPNVYMGRIGNMNNFSSKMVLNENYTAVDLEYFTYVEDAFWLKSDEELLEIGKLEIDKLGIVKYCDIVDGMVLRSTQAYPVYDENYKQNLKEVLDYLSRFPNLKLMGRNGTHQYNNMDLAMISAFNVVEEINLNSDQLIFDKDNHINKQNNLNG